MFQTFFKVGEIGQQQSGVGTSTQIRSNTRDDVAVEIDEYREAFVFYDTDRDGRLSGDE